MSLALVDNPGADVVAGNHALTQEEMDEIERITDKAGGGPVLVELPPIRQGEK
jgi:DNA transposition AAA+ family ATPase